MPDPAPELPSAEVVEAARRLIAAHVPVTEDDLSAAEVYGAWVWTVPGPTLAQVIVAYADRLATAEVARDEALRVVEVARRAAGWIECICDGGPDDECQGCAMRTELRAAVAALDAGAAPKRRGAEVTDPYAGYQPRCPMPVLSYEYDADERTGAVVLGRCGEPLCYVQEASGSAYLGHFSDGESTTWKIECGRGHVLLLPLDENGDDAEPFDEALALQAIRAIAASDAGAAPDEEEREAPTE